MGKIGIRIVLTERKSINGAIRKPGYVLLEGICPSKVAADDISKAIQLKQVKAEAVKSEPEVKDPEKDKSNTGGPQE